MSQNMKRTVKKIRKPQWIVFLMAHRCRLRSRWCRPRRASLRQEINEGKIISQKMEKEQSKELASPNGSSL